MREILFKAKTEGGKWIEGDLIHYESGEVAILEKFSKYGYEATEICRRTKVQVDTVCQYTGLKDKNGRKIWEGDIVCTPYVDPIFGDMVNTTIVNDFRWKVVFYDGLFVVENETKRIYLRDFTNGNNIEVIGNIFDNKELLEN